MIVLDSKQRAALRGLAVVASIPLMLQISGPRPACAAPALAPALAPAAGSVSPALKLFPDSRLVTRDRISVEVVGQGPDVVLIPGLASSREIWRRTATRLRGSYRLHLVQVAGFAGEPARANASGPVVALTVADIDGYIVQAGLKRPAVVGHSLGGVMALELALDHSDHVGKVFVVDSLAFYTELVAGPQATADAAKPFADALAAKMTAQTDAEATAAAPQTAAMMVTAPADRARLVDWMSASSRPVTASAMAEDMTTDLRPRLASLSPPLTVIYEAPLAQLITADYAPVRTKTLVAAAPGAKHFIMYDDPAGFDAALDAFLAR